MKKLSGKIALLMAALIVISLTLAACGKEVTRTQTQTETVTSTAPSAASTVTVPSAPLTVTVTSSPTPPPTAAPVTGASITISPEEDYNPVMTQHTVVAKVLDEAGKPAKGATVEWILNRFPQAVGDIVEIGAASTEGKVDNYYAVTKADASGEARITITSTRPGDTDITAYAPSIKDPAKHKVFAVKHWINLKPIWPEDAVNLAGTTHVFKARVVTVVAEAQLPGYPPGWTSIRKGVNVGLPGYQVRWTIVDDDPAAYFGEGGQSTKVWVSTTDKDGNATVSLKQVRPSKGDNTVLIEVLAPDGVPMFQQQVKKTWISPAIQLTKQGPETALLGEEVTYKMVLKNTGDGNATQVTLKDTLPEGLTFVSSDASGQFANGMVTWSLGTMAPNDSKTVTLVLKAAKPGTWTNVAKATAAEGMEAVASATTRVMSPSIDIEKTGPSARYLRQVAEYTIKVRNTGDSVLNDVVVTDEVPEGMKYISSTLQGTASGRNVTWKLGTMAAGEAKQFNVTLSCEQPGTWTNKATVTTKEGVSAASEKKTMVVVVSGVTISSTDTPDPIAVGEQTTYIITVRNQGEIDVHNLVITDMLSTLEDFVSAKGPSSFSVDGKKVTFQPVSVLASGKSLTYEITVKALDKGAAINKATLTYTEFAEAVAVEEGTTIFKVE